MMIKQVQMLVIFIASCMLLLSCESNKYSDRGQNNLNSLSKSTSEIAFYNTQLGLAYLTHGNRPKAKQKLLKALEMMPSSPSINSAVAYYYELVGEVDSARDYHHKALNLSFNKGPALNNYGAFLCRQGKYHESEMYFLKAVKDNKYLNTAGAYENAGLCLAEANEYPRAIYYLKKALKQDPLKKSALSKLVEIQITQNKLEKALKHIKMHEKLVLSDSHLLDLAIKVANLTGNKNLKEYYTIHL